MFKLLFFLFLNKIITFFSNNKLIIKLLNFSKIFFNNLNMLDGFTNFIILKLKKRTKNIKFIDKKKLDKIILKLKNNDFLKIFLFSLIKVFLKLLKVILNFLGFIIYAVWSYLNTILLYAIGYILLEFGATRIYDPNQDITSREIWTVISEKLHTLKKKYFSKEYFNTISNKFQEKLVHKLLLIYKSAVSFFFFLFFKLFNKNDLFNNLFTYLASLVFLFIINNFLFFKKIFYLENFKKDLNFFFRNFKMYLSLNYFNIFFNLFKKKLFFLNKFFVEQENLLNVLDYKTHTVNFKSYFKIITKLKQKMLYIKNVFQFNRFKNYFCYRIKFWSTQKRFLYFYIKLLKKSEKIKMGALRVIYIEEWWVYKFYSKNYVFGSFFKVITVFYNLIKGKVAFMFLYLNLIIDLISF